MTTSAMSQAPTGRAVPRASLAMWAAAGVIALYLALALVGRLPGIGVGNDDATYYFLAKALLQGTYRDIYLPDAPWHVQYPPGWPLLMAVPLAIVGDRPEVLLILPLLLSAGGLVLLYLTARRVLSPFAAVALLLLVSVNPLMVTYGGRLKAEAAFFFFAMLALWALAAPDASRRRLLVGCGAAIASAFMRSVGVGVIAAVVLHFALARRWRWAAGFSLVAALTFGPWLAWSVLGPRQVLGRSYAGDMVQIEAARAAATGRHPAISFAVTTFNRIKVYAFGDLHAVMGFKQASGTLADNVGWLVTLLGFGTVGAVALWRRLRPSLLILGGICAVLAVWTWADRRFLHPVAPLLGLVFVAGGEAIGRRFGRVGQVAGPLAVLAVLTPGTLRYTGDVMRRGLPCELSRPVETCYTPVERSFLEAAVAARALPDSAVVLSQREAAFAYHAGRKSAYAREAIERADDRFAAFLFDQGITHILISRVTGDEPVELAERLVAMCDRLEIDGEFDNLTVLFRIATEDQPAARNACPRTAVLYAEVRSVFEERVRNIDVFRLPDP